MSLHVSGVLMKKGNVDTETDTHRHRETGSKGSLLSDTEKGLGQIFSPQPSGEESLITPGYSLLWNWSTRNVCGVSHSLCGALLRDISPINIFIWSQNEEYYCMNGI